jgi:hypothetical protein
MTGAIYRVYYATYREGPKTLLAEGLTTPSYLHTGLGSGDTYWYFVTATNGSTGGMGSDYSEPVAGVAKNPIAYTLTQTGGYSDTRPSTGIKITFNAAVTDLTADDITISSVTKGTLSRSSTDWKEWTIALTEVPEQKSVNFTITRDGIDTSTHTVQVYNIFTFTWEQVPVGSVDYYHVAVAALEATCYISSARMLYRYDAAGGWHEDRSGAGALTPEDHIVGIAHAGNGCLVLVQNDKGRHRIIASQESGSTAGVSEMDMLPTCIAMSSQNYSDYMVGGYVGYIYYSRGIPVYQIPGSSYPTLFYPLDEKGNVPKWKIGDPEYNKIYRRDGKGNLVVNNEKPTTNLLISDKITCIANGAGMWVAATNTGKIAYFSADTWHVMDAPARDQVNCITYGGNKFFAGTRMGYMYSFSPNSMENWTSVAETDHIFRPANTEYYRPWNITGIAYGGGKYVAVGENGIAYSMDGIKWYKSNTEKANCAFYDVAYDGSDFIIAGTNGSIVTSSATCYRNN